MITDKQIQKAIRQAPGSGKAIELRDPGPRGSGRLTMAVRPFPGGRVASEWYVVYYRGGRRCMAKLGSYPQTTIVAARAIFASDYVTAISAGLEPETMARRRAQKNGTVKELFEAYVDHLRRGGKRVADMVHSMLLAKATGAADAIGASRPASSIEPADIVPHLAAIHARGVRTQANAVRAYISAAFAFGMKAEHDFTRTSQGTPWNLKTNPVSAYSQGCRSLSPGRPVLVPVRVPGVLALAGCSQGPQLVRVRDHAQDGHWAAERGNPAGSPTQVMIGPGSMLTWDKTKNGRPHSLPLPHQAVALFDELAPNGHGLYFPRRGHPDQAAGHDAMRHLVDDFLEVHPIPKFNARDLRRTWKTLAGDAGIPKDMRDRLQNHAQGSDVSSRHYDRYDYLPERRAAMAKWAAYLDLMIEGKVDQIGGRPTTSCRLETERQPDGEVS